LALVFNAKLLLFLQYHSFEVLLLGVKLLVDGEEIELNEFASKILSGTMVGAVTSLRDVKKDWKQIELKITK
jgi:hypothetical protein